MKRSIYVKNNEDINVNKTIYHGSAFQMEGVSEVFSMSASLTGIYCYNLGDVIKLSISDLKRIARAYKTWHNSIREIKLIEDGFDIYVIREVTKTLYQYGLSLSCNFDKVIIDSDGGEVDCSYYPIDYLPLNESIKMILFNNNIYYIGNIMEHTYSELTRLLGSNIVELEDAIYDNLGVSVLSAFITNSIIRAEKSMLELKSQLGDINKISVTADEILDLNDAVRREKERLELIEYEIDNIIGKGSFGDNNEKRQEKNIIR